MRLKEKKKKKWVKKSNICICICVYMRLIICYKYIVKLCMRVYVRMRVYTSWKSISINSNNNHKTKILNLLSMGLYFIRQRFLDLNPLLFFFLQYVNYLNYARENMYIFILKNTIIIIINSFLVWPSYRLLLKKKIWMIWICFFFSSSFLIIKSFIIN